MVAMDGLVCSYGADLTGRWVDVLNVSVATLEIIFWVIGSQCKNCSNGVDR